MKGITLKIILIALVISIIGICAIYSNTYQKEGKLWQTIYQRQIFWVVVGVCFFFIMYNVSYRRLWDLTYFLYGLAVLLLFLVAVLGHVSLGAQRWLRFAWFNFQPSELAKLATIVLLAKYFSAKSVDDVSVRTGKFGLFRALIIPFLLIGIPIGLIIEQPDLGSGIIVFLIFFVMLYLGKIKMRFILALFLMLVAVMPLFWNLLRGYQKDRLLVFLNPNLDPLGAGYTIIQSKIAIGSAGLFGKGWLSGTQNQLYFLPESHTDFIFAAFVEEQGLLGGMGLILLYYFLIRQGIYIAERTQDEFGKLLALGITFFLSIQIFVNIAMNLGLAPVVGLPLPLMSYGGSSVLITFISLGILANINKTRAVFG